MFCSNCGTNNYPNTRFCQRCGNQLDVNNPYGYKKQKASNALVIIISLILGIISIIIAYFYIKSEIKKDLSLKSYVSESVPSYYKL